MSLPPEGDRPGGEEPSEGIPPEDLETPEDVHGDLPDLEPEFVDALREAAGEGSGEAVEPSEQTPEEPLESESEQPTAERPLPKQPAEADASPADAGSPSAPGDWPPADGDAAPDQTVEFTPQEAAEAQQAAKEGESEKDEDGESDKDDEEQKDAEGEDKPRRTVVIGAGPDAQPSEGTTAPGASVPPPTPTTAGTPTAPAQPAPPAQPAAAAATSATAGIPQKPPPEGDYEPAPKRKRLWLRFLIASLLIVASMGAATGASALIFLNDIAGKLGDLRGVKQQLLPPETGQPENILIVGSDKRASLKGTKGLSDTTILLRLDPNNHAIALMSIPRDLKTYIPGVGTTKFNAAYAYGGPKLTLRVVKRITGLSINHVVNVDFLGFVRAVNAIGCVYVDVDRRYYNSNVGVPPSLQYAEINIQPGYQKLCGKDALEYVRYRHTDTDLVRSARQQDFLREARQQVPASDLFINKRKQLLDIFTTYTTSDISSGETLLQVLKLFVASRNAPIKEVHFPALLHPSYITASKPAIQQAVDQFRGIEATGGPRGSLDLPRSSGQTGIVPEERKRAKATKKTKQGPKAPPTPSPANDGLVDASQFSHDLAAKVAAKTLRSFPVFYPRRLPAGSIYVQQPRVYHLRDQDKNKHGAYAEVLQLPQGDYFDVQGVHGWSDPPILSNPSESRTMNGRDYDIFLDGDRIRLISWHQGDNSYWVGNSLLQTLSNNQMLGIARSIGKLPGQRHLQHGKKKR
ncbi:MAG: LCP family protein [Actinomycetota bacterium]